MSYHGESYRQNTGCFCERCHRLYGIRKDDTRDRLVVLATGSGVDIYACEPCIGDVHQFLQANVNHPKMVWHLTRDAMLNHMDPGSRIVRPLPEALRRTMSNYGERERELMKKIRALEAPYTNRNLACAHLHDLFRDIFNDVEMYLQKT